MLNFKRQNRLKFLAIKQLKFFAPNFQQTTIFERLTFRQITDKIIDEAIYQRRLVVLMPFMMILGLIIYKILPFEPNITIIFLLAAFALALFFWQFGKESLNILLLLFLFIWFGFALLPIYSNLFGTKMLSYPIFGNYQAKVDKIISQRQDGQRLIISNITPIDGAKPLNIKKARLFVRKGEVLQRGDIIMGDIRFAPVPSPALIYGYDAQFHSYFSGIGAFANMVGEPKIVKRKENKTFLGIIDKLRGDIGQIISENLQNSKGAIALALIVGDQTKIKETTRYAMANSGLAHMLAISGLHLTIVAGGVFALVRMVLALFYSFAQKYPIKKIAAIFGILAALIYLALSGASISAIRATIMLILIFGAVIAGRDALTMRNVAFAAIIIIIIDPTSVFRPSFQLSFSAVVALIATYEIFRFRFGNNEHIANKLLLFFASLATTSLIAGLATFVFAAFHFQQIAPFGVLANLAALPILTFIVLPSAFIAVILLPFGLAPIFLNITGFGIDLILNVAFKVSDLSANFDYNLILTPISLFIMFVSLAWLAFFTGKIKFVAPILALPIILIFSLDEAPDILIADNSKAIAIRGEQRGEQGSKQASEGQEGQYGLALLAGRAPSFITNVWQSNYQEEIGKKLSSVKCDYYGCLYSSPLGFSISLIKRGRAAFIEDCYRVDLVITRLTAPKFCKEITNVIDRDSLKTGGVHWLKWQGEKGEFLVKRAIKHKNRAWRIKN